MQDAKYTFIDLFSGCGGLSLGFEMAGYKSLLAIDNWQDALDTYKHNNPDARTLLGDLSKINPEDIKREYNIDRVNVIIGGPPCQGFSIAGKRIIDDERNKLYKSFVAFVRCFMPDAFVMENVPNILSIGGGVVKESIIKDFRELGYNVTYKVLLASDYGVPQNRRRAVFVGLKNGEYTFPLSSITKPITSEEALSDLPDNSVTDGDNYPLAPQSKYQQMIRNGAMTLHNHQATIHTEQTTRIIAMVLDGGNYKDLPEEFQQTRKVNIAWTRLNSKKPSITIDTGHNHHFHYKYNRVPTARESARLQSFPDTYVFTSGKTSQLKQIGNAVPPLMAMAIAKQLKSQL